ncbi:histidine kinase [Leptospira wolffii]|uniref:histidine kinase n=1 Tax=Leptospira wolffii TaxID=409998 RepID=A0A2M9Z8N4_9LEPT|nr:HAMP domain-containing sensor histidine kinase [Leptospira wolffii]PJZ64692.1 histidine kinase [Leptospira wolffii]
MSVPDDHPGNTREADPKRDSETTSLKLLRELFDTYAWETSLKGPSPDFPPQLAEILNVSEPYDHSYFIQRIHPDDFHKWEALVQESKKGIGNRLEEIRFLDKNSDARYFKTTIGRSQGSEENFLILLQDVTKTKTSQESLHQITQRLKLATRTANVGIWDLNLSLNILVWDEAMYRLYGIREDEFSGAYDAWVNGLHPEDKERATQELQEALDGTREFNTEFRVLWPNGEVRYIKAIAAVLRDPEGRPTQMIGTNWDITQIRSAEKEKRRNQEIISKMNEVAKIGSWEIDFRNDKVIWSKKTKEIHGLPESYEPKKEDFLRFARDGESRKKISEAQSNSLQLGIGYDMDIQIVLDSGKFKWVRTLGQAEFKNGKCIRLYGIYQDIDERRRIEDNLLVSESTFRGAFENSGIGMSLVSTEGRWLKVNRKLCEMLGYPEEELLVTTFQDITHPEDLEKDMNYVGQMLRGEIRTYSMEKRYFRKDRSIIWINLSVSMVRDSDGKPMYFVSQIEDITQKKIAEENLISVHDEMKLILDSATQVAIIRTDINGIISHFSKGAENVLGYSSAEIVGTRTPEFFHVPEEMTERSEELVKEIGEKTEGFESLVAIAKRDRFESKIWRYRRKDGSVFPAQLVVTSIFNGESEITGFLGVVTDISETVNNQKKLEETKKQLETLAEQLGQRNAQLLNYAHITSHNLRAPTSNLISLLELIQESETPAETENLIHKFKISVEYLRETLDSLVEVLRIQEFANRELELIKAPPILEKIRKILEGKILETETEIDSDFSAFDEWEYNRSYLESILLNLISNSIKYRSPDRKPKIRIFTEISQGKYYLNVEDNGLGIDLNKNRGKLFGLHKTFHRHPEARGVGLFLTKTQVESLGGRIFAESKPDFGSKFTIEIPSESVASEKP